MKRIQNDADLFRGTVTYELPDGRWITFDARALQTYGLAALMRAHDLDQFIPTERLPVIQDGRRVGTMAPDFDPITARSRSFLYDVRPGDFRREGDAWIVGRSLGGGDLDCVAGFRRDI